VTYLIPKQTQWLPQAGSVAVPISLFPVPAYVWQTAGWIVLFALFAILLMRSDSGHEQGWPNRSARRVTVATLALMWAFALVARILTGKTYEPAISPFAVAVAAGLLFVASLIALRPPRTAIIVAGLFASGFLARVIGIAFTAMDKDYSDNLPAILAGLERLVHGQTPYIFVDFGTHVNPMGYLPWTVLSYLPPFALGFDIRVTNVLLSLAAAAYLLVIVTRLPLSRPARNSLGLLVGLIYAAPNSIGFDLYTEWQFFTLALIVAFGLLVMGRLRFAAASYGFALAAMPMALFCAPALCGYVIRRRGWREFAILAAIAAASASPIVFVLIWDSGAFVAAFTSAPLEYWQRLDSGDPSWPYLLAWHGWLLGQLRFVQLAILAGAVALAGRVRTPFGALRLGIASYVGLSLSGPFIAPHVFSPVLWLLLMAAAVRASELHTSAPEAHDLQQPIASRRQVARQS